MGNSTVRTMRLALLLAVVLSTAQAQFTLEQIMSAPFPSEVAAAPRGGKVAWVLNVRGVRNIRAAEAPDYRAKPITSYAADDGQNLADLEWTPDGAAVVFVRGGQANSAGEYPNPSSDPAGAEQAVWIVSAGGGEPKRLDEGHSPKVSPKGQRVAYVKKGQIWSVALDGSGQPARLIAARGLCGTIRWSPDGGALAFVSARGDHSFIGVHDVAAKTVRYVDPGVDRDGSPAWSPDGKRIAFQRIPTTREADLFGPKRSAEPWSIRVAEAATGRGREAWRAKPGRGSAYYGIPAQSQLLWADGDRLVFPWEADGWMHLYSVAAAGGEARLLTPGEFEVEHVSLSADRKEAIFSSNQEDIDRRHIWRVAAAGGAVRRVTSGSGIETSPVMTADRSAIAFFRSDAQRPARAAIVAGGAVPRDLAPEAIPAEFPDSGLVEPQPVTFSAADGMTIRGQLFLPAGARQGERRPAVIFLHGGSRRQMLLGWHYMDYYHNAYAFNQYLAARGYVVLSANYRSGIGYGMEFREALNYGAVGASEYNDVLGAGLYLRSRPDVDPKRVGLWGGSYGGYLTALGLARASDLFAAGVDLHGVHDWRTESRVFAPSDDPAVREEATQLAFQSSPMAYVKDWRSPVLLIHGDDDRSVEFRQTVELAGALRKQGVEFEQLIFPDEEHGFLVHARWIEAFHAAEEFFTRRLEKEK